METQQCLADLLGDLQSWFPLDYSHNSKVVTHNSNKPLLTPSLHWFTILMGSLLLQDSLPSPHPRRQCGEARPLMRRSGRILGDEKMVARAWEWL